MPFREIVGHRRILDLLARSIRHDALPPSLLFAGPPGSPAKDAAIALAQALNCHSPSEGDSCGVCSACVRIARGTHPDVQLVEPGDTGLIRIDPIRDVIERSAYRPFEGRRRVIIVQDADALMPQAQNALLKTLEEPPPSSVFILISARPDALLPTVRSRLIRLSFAAMGPAEVDPDARTVAEQVLARSAASADAAHRLEAAKGLLEKTGAGGATDREQLASHLHAVALLLRDVEVVASGADPRLLAVPESQATLERLTRAFRGERGVHAFEIVERGIEALDGNAGVKVVADWVALQL